MGSQGFNLRRFLKVTSLYAIGDLLTKGARLVLIPYYVYVLSKSEVGMLGVLQAISIFSWTLFAFGLGFAIPRFYFQYGDRADRAVAGIWWGRMAVMLLPCAALSAIGYFAGESLLSGIPPHLIALAVMAGFLRGGFNIVESWFMIREQPVAYRTFTVLQFLTTTAVIIYLVSFRQMGVAGVIIGELAVNVLWTIVSAVALSWAGRPHFQQLGLSRLSKYCVTLVPHTFFMCALAYSDRIILQWYVALSDLGVYEIGHTLASGLSIAALAMRAAWLPTFFKAAHEPSARKEFSETASFFCSVLFFAGTAMVLFAPEGLRIVTGGGYEGGVSVLRLVSIGLVGQGIFMGLNQPILYEGRNGLLSLSSLLAITVNVGLNLWWVPQFGMMGAAVALLVAYGTLAAAAFWISGRCYDVAWNWGLIFKSALIAVLVGALGCLIPHNHLLLSIPAKTMLLLVQLILLYQLSRRGDKARRVVLATHESETFSPPEPQQPHSRTLVGSED